MTEAFLKRIQTFTEAEHEQWLTPWVLSLSPPMASCHKVCDLSSWGLGSARPAGSNRTEEFSWRTFGLWQTELTAGLQAELSVYKRTKPFTVRICHRGYLIGIELSEFLLVLRQIQFRPLSGPTSLSSSSSAQPLLYVLAKQAILLLHSILILI